MVLKIKINMSIKGIRIFNSNTFLFLLTNQGINNRIKTKRSVFLKGGLQENNILFW